MGTWVKRGWQRASSSEPWPEQAQVEDRGLDDDRVLGWIMFVLFEPSRNRDFDPIYEFVLEQFPGTGLACRNAANTIIWEIEPE